MSRVVTLNAGSSSLKFAVHEGPPRRRVLAGDVERIGSQARLRVGDEAREIGRVDHAGAVAIALEEARRADAVGHRIVHGGPGRDRPAVIDGAVMAELEAVVPLAPLHQPHNLAAVRAAREAFPDGLQVACFDTAFYRTQSRVAQTYALPRRFYDEEGIRRYGFHGLSYEAIARRLAADHPALHAGRVVVAHLGNGASVCAMRGGASVATSMGFTALDGLVMGTRCGQIDPGVLIHLMRRGMDADAIETLLCRESGLEGLSDGLSDMRALLASDAPEAAEAVAVFLLRLRREIGAMAAVLGGLDGLVFTAGIGENSPEIRAGAVEGLGFLGLEIDPDANAARAEAISRGAAPILRIETDEEGVIADAVLEALARGG